MQLKTELQLKELLTIGLVGESQIIIIVIFIIIVIIILLFYFSFPFWSSLWSCLCFRFLNPLVNGDYPKIMKKNAGRKIPVFTKDESTHIKGSIDFIAVNHYDTLYVRDKSSNLEMDNRDLFADMATEVMCMWIPYENLSFLWWISSSYLGGSNWFPFFFIAVFYGYLPPVQVRPWM